MYNKTKYLSESASQTAGPYVHIGCTPNFAEINGVYPEDLGSKMIIGDAKGERITIKGYVYDGTGTPLRDAMVEVWQADSAGFYNSPEETRGTADPHFTGFGRCPTAADTGEFRFDTVKPGPVVFLDGKMQAPHVTLWVVARGINLGLQTRCYFGDEDEANASDPLINRVELEIRRKTLIAKPAGNGIYEFDIHLQGEQETVFLDM